MAKLPYGGFEADPPEQTPEQKLKSIQQALYTGQCPPPALAQWLGQAIEQALLAEDAGAALLFALGLRRRPGRPGGWGDDAWLVWGGRIDYLVAVDGLSVEQALGAVQQEAGEATGKYPERFTLQRWLDQYREAERIGREP